jgi:hypothetical protein
VESPCAICEILATKAPEIAPEPPPDAAAQPRGAVAPAEIAHAAPRGFDFSLVGAPRGPPPSPSPA